MSEETPNLHDEKCPECESDDVMKSLCEDFIEDGSWEEFTCRACGHNWESGRL